MHPGKRFTISTDTTNSVVRQRWERELPVARAAKSVRRAARIASLCLLAYWLVIFAGTHLPSSNLPQVTVSDKLCHAAAFAGLAFLLAWALPNRGGRMRHVVWAGAIALGYSCVDELTQNFVPGRTCDIWDLAADAVGIFLGILAYLALRFALMQVRWGRTLLAGLSR